jgi:DNA-binding transcriptional MocR family regulator
MKEILHEIPGPCDLSAGYAPKHIKPARILRARIQDGDFSNGQYLSRIKLAAEYDVSLGTALGALPALAVNGYLKIEEYDFPKRPGHRFRAAFPRQPETEFRNRRVAEELWQPPDWSRP